MNASSSPSLQVGTGYRHILQVATPIAFAILVPQLNFVINNIFLGHLNQDLLAVAGLTGVFYLIFAVIGNGLNAGLQSLISRKAGENNVEGLNTVFVQGILIALFMSVVGILITYTVAPGILHYAIRDPQNAERAIRFLQIRIWGLPFLYLYQMRNALLVGTNNSKLLVYGTVVETGLNVVMDYALIFGHLGMPAMGFDGAAYASIVAEAGGLISLFFVMRLSGLNKRLKLFQQFPFDKNSILELLDISAPLIGQYAISVISWEFFYILVEHHGNQALAISNIMRNVFGLCGCVCWAFAAASNSMVANVIGQDLPDKVLPLVRRIMRLSLGFAASVALLLNLFPSFFLSFYAQDADFVQAAVPVLRVVSTALMFMAVSTVWLNAVVGTGYSRLNLLSELLAISAYCLFVYLVLERWFMSITWGWTSEYLYWIIMFMPSFWYMHSGRWRKRLKTATV